ncbi:tetratricopeptide repeat protein [Candidatus Dependentiae bacterium]|nr:tetratricopeptide repeat protein [Candidatus Dependentiae bacterium]
MKVLRIPVYSILVIFLFLIISGCPKPPEEPVEPGYEQDEKIERLINITKPKKIKEDIIKLHIIELNIHLKITTGKKTSINIFQTKFPSINLINRYWEVPEIDLINVKNSLSKIKFNEDKFINSPQDYKKILRKEEHLKKIFLLGCYYFKTGNHSKGSAILNGIVKVSPKKAEYLLLIAEIFFSKFQYNKALEVYDVILYASPLYSDQILKRKITILKLKNNRKGIETIYENLINYDAASIQYYNEYISYLIELKKYTAALKLIKKASKKFDPGTFLISELEILERQQKIDQAIKLARNYLKDNPYNYKVSTRYKRLLSESSNFETYKKTLLEKEKKGKLKKFELVDYFYFYSDLNYLVEYINNIKASEKWLHLADYFHAINNQHYYLKALNTHLLENPKQKNNHDLKVKIILALINLNSFNLYDAFPYGELLIGSRPGGISGFFSVVYERNTFFQKYYYLNSSLLKVNNKLRLFNYLETMLKDIEDESLRKKAYLTIVNYHQKMRNWKSALSFCRRFIKKSDDSQNLKIFFNKILYIKKQTTDFDTEYEDILKHLIVEYKDNNAKYYLKSYYMKQKKYRKIIEFYQEVYRYNPYSNGALLDLLNVYMELANNSYIIDNCSYYIEAYNLVESKIDNEKNYQLVDYFYRMNFRTKCSKGKFNVEFLEKYWWYSTNIERKYFESLFHKGALESEILKAKIEISNNPDNYKKIYFIAKAYSWMSMYEEALPYFEDLNEKFPGNKKFIEPLSNLYESFDKPKKAAMVYDKIILQNPLNKDNYIQAGDILAEAGYVEEGIEYFKEIIKIDRNNQNLFKELATIYFDYGYFEEAISVIIQVRIIQDDEFLYAKELAALYEQLGDNKKAITEYLKILVNRFRIKETQLKNYHTNYYEEGYYEDDDYYYDDVDYYENRVVEGQIRKRLKYLALKKELKEEIELQLNSLLDRNPNEAAVYYEFALFYKDVKELEKSYSILVRGTKKCKGEYFHEQVIKYFEQEEQYQLLKNEYFRLIGYYPKKQKYYYKAIKYFTTREEEKNRIKVLKQLIKVFPEKLDLAYYYKNIKQYNRAVKEFEKVSIRFEDKFKAEENYYTKNQLINIYSHLSDLYVKLEKFNKAYSTFDRLIYLDKDNITHIIQKARILENQGQSKEAKQLLQKSIQKFRQLERKDKYRYSSKRISLHREFIRYFIDKGKFKTVLQFYMEMLEITPLDETLAHEVFLYSQKQNLYENLFKHFKGIQEKVSRDYRYAYLCYYLKFLEKDYSSSAEYIEKAIFLEPGRIDLNYKLVDLYKAQNEYQKAITALEKIIKLYPTYNVLQYEELGTLYFQIGNEAMAVKSWKKIVKVFGRKGYSYYYSIKVFKILLKHKLYKHAEELLIKLKKDSIKKWEKKNIKIKLLKLYMLTGRYKKALDSAISDFKSQYINSSYYSYKKRQVIVLFDYVDSLRLIKKEYAYLESLKLPRHEPMLLMLADMYIRHGDIWKGIELLKKVGKHDIDIYRKLFERELYEEILKEEGQLKLSDLFLARVEIKLKKYEDARTRLEKSAHSYPKLYGEILAELGMIDEAIKYGSEILEELPLRDIKYLEFSEYLLKLGLKEEAIKYFDFGLYLKNDFNNQLKKAKFLYKLGDDTAAIEYLNSIKEKNIHHNSRLINIAKTFNEIGHPEIGIDILSTIIDEIVKAKDPYNWQMTDVIYFIENNYHDEFANQKIEIFEKLSNSFPKQNKFLEDVINLYWKTEQYQELINFISRKRIEQNDILRNDYLLKLYILSLIKINDFDEAEMEIEKLITSRNPTKLEIGYEALTNLNYAQGDFDACKRNLKKYYGLNHSYSIHIRKSADLAEEFSFQELAIQYRYNYYKMNPDSIKEVLKLISLLNENNKHKEAIDIYTELLTATTEITKKEQILIGFSSFKLNTMLGELTEELKQLIDNNPNELKYVIVLIKTAEFIKDEELFKKMKNQAELINPFNFTLLQFEYEYFKSLNEQDSLEKCKKMMLLSSPVRYRKYFKNEEK